jgi:polysaccharide export outer membrane protein
MVNFNLDRPSIYTFPVKRFLRFCALNLRLLLSPILLFYTFSSCTPTKELQYFQDFPDGTVTNLAPLEAEQRAIQKSDRLFISFGAQDAEAAAIFNRYGGISTSGTDALGAAGSGSADAAGFFVDQDGLIDLPLLGKIKADGLTTAQLKDALLRNIKSYLTNPYVSVTVLDFKVTVLGEVRSPGTYNLPQSHPSIFHALGASGDLLRTAKRYDISLIRDYNGARTVTKIDLRSKDLLSNSQAFFLKNNDVIYVQPRKASVGENPGLIAGVISALISVATLLVTVNK